MSGGEARELRRLATFPRDQGDTEVRWSWDEYSDGDKSSKYISGRKWFKGTDDEWHPTKAGLTIRLAELDELVTALQRVQRARDGQGGRQPKPAGVRDAGHAQGATEPARRSVSCEELDAEGVF